MFAIYFNRYFLIGDVKPTIQNDASFNGFLVDHTMVAHVNHEHYVGDLQNWMPLSDFLEEVYKHIGVIEDDYRIDDIILYGFDSVIYDSVVDVSRIVKFDGNTILLQWKDDGHSTEDYRTIKQMVNLSSIMRQLC